ncbi:phosphoenolpyruvate carboxykinase (GTP) [Corynebacterium diphtheriae]|uniref:phosphoenolpyruvate carboxykinase (GTP) n=1 Tax=Corynebacterium diphtheriae TaxID=1717 RepID=UPI000B4B436D|nr:phosphoenolpyruvate carboxykinase (GTP) [Corynebacterium diphtheriae]OWN56749.1 phosphoenolpyruvate carboxykinase [Corynebacterium diphtheriae bv. gravis]OWN67465.1 phosphoenolpyruvate carboxykinase [Corynebacterium diphtheriae bv. gravis]OWN85569.1 phosphoenolpyruvate carboxykinase [Corynebacterium diphtheriae bv. gravis]OWN91719.1 phosphoenolpyruvate carboxykinase [Corynebacterium diphtheriae bv. gravis]OWO01996.1 phosphoenolpyruvate carboxykinase [Corynebacterium diphtheriae bv. gravis]
MSTVSIKGLEGEAPTKNEVLLNWIAENVELFRPDRVVFADGSQEEWDRLTTQLVESGTLIRLNEEKRPNSFLARSNPADVARVESRTFICTPTPEGAGPTNHWADPAEMKAELTERFRGSMKGRTMYVVPFCMGPINDPAPKLGVQLTDSEYVVLSMRIMTRMGAEALAKIGDTGSFVPCLHSVGAPLEPGQEDVAWPCNEEKYITHFPETKEIWSYGSGYGGNAILAKKCYALRIASVMAKEEGWMAEHMLILKLTSPEKKVYYIAAAFPSACGKTNLAMLQPTIDGWSAEVVGDDIAWLRFGEDGRLYAINPENGFFGVAPGTNYSSNPNAMRTMEPGNTLFTNVALTDDGDIWWEDLENMPEHLTDWLGNDWTPESSQPSSHPNSRYCVPLAQCPVAAEEYNDPQGVPISAILFGGRRPDTVPLVSQAHNWDHATMIGALLSSGQTAAAEGTVGALRHDPMAMLPFIGYNAADYLQHWIDMGKKGGDKMPEVFLVNWFRRGDDGRFLWPGFGDNSRVLKWIVDRIEGRVEADETIAGYTARVEDLDLTGLDTPIEDIREALSAPAAQWKSDLADNEEYLTFLGSKGSAVPAEVLEQFEALKARVAAAES